MYKNMRPFRNGAQNLARNLRLNASRRRFLSTPPPPPPQPEQTTNPRIARLLNSRFLGPFKTRILSPLRNAPISTITAFLILHEITAVVPLLFLAGLFHYTQWLPSYFSEGIWVVKGVEMFGRYFRKKGWISEGAEKEAERKVKEGRAEEVEPNAEGGSKIKQTAGKWFGVGETGTRVVVEFATAWAVVKVLVPFRLMVSVWWAEGFARRVILPLGRMMRGKKKAISTGK